MKKIKCLSQNNNGKSILFGHGVVTFDKDGLAEVENADEMVKKYPRLICLEGSEPVKVVEPVKVETKVVDNKKEKELLAQIEDLKIQLEKNIALEISGKVENTSSIKEEDVLIIYDMCRESAKTLKESAAKLGFLKETVEFTHKELVLFLVNKVLKDANA
jgi:hypothetical protein